MGYSLPKERRLKLLRESGALVERGEVDPDVTQWVVVDLNTQVRLVTTGHEVSALTAAHRLLKRVTEDATRAAVIIVADDSSKLPEIRAAVQAKRLRVLSEEGQRLQARRGKLIVQNRAFSPGTEPYSDDDLAEIRGNGIRAPVNWTRLLANSRGKAVAYALMAKAIEHSAQGVIRDPSFRLLLWHTGSVPYTFPRNWDPALVDMITDNAYGEADERVTEAVRAIETVAAPDQAHIVVRTIDTDMLIQVLVAPVLPNVAMGGSLLVQFKNELVDAVAWKSFFDTGSPDELASNALMLVLASGCDYNSGLTPYGYRNAAIVQAARHAGTFCSINRETDTCTVDLVGLARAVRGIKRSNPLKDAGAFGEELENATYTVAYFSGIKRRSGGPGRTRATILRARADQSGESEFEAFAALALEHPSPELTMVF